MIPILAAALTMALVSVPVPASAQAVSCSLRTSGAVLSELEVPTDFVPARRAQRFVPTSVWNDPEEGANPAFWSKVPVIYDIEIYPSKE